MTNYDGKGSILGLFAHPDDETFICGGTLAHYAKLGFRVTVVSATKGEMGRRMGNPPYTTRESMPRLREGELREACRCLGIEEPIFLGIRDKTVEFEDFDPLVERLRSIIADLSPNVVLTFHPEWGGHPDHCAIGRAAVSAVEALHTDEEARKPGAVTPALYFISFGEPARQLQSRQLTSEDVVRVDVSDSLREKLGAFRAHRSQSEIDEWVWQADKSALSRFHPCEYFIAARPVTGRRSPKGTAYEL